MIDGNGNELKIGDRVYAIDLIDGRVEGVLLKNDEYPEVSEYYVRYDDGGEYAVIDFSVLFKVNGQ